MKRILLSSQPNRLSLITCWFFVCVPCPQHYNLHDLHNNVRKAGSVKNLLELLHNSARQRQMWLCCRYPLIRQWFPPTHEKRTFQVPTHKIIGKHSLTRAWSRKPAIKKLFSQHCNSCSKAWLYNKREGYCTHSDIGEEPISDHPPPLVQASLAWQWRSIRMIIQTMCISSIWNNGMQQKHNSRHKMQPESLLFPYVWIFSRTFSKAICLSPSCMRSQVGGNTTRKGKGWKKWKLFNRRDFASFLPWPRNSSIFRLRKGAFFFCFSPYCFQN